MSYNEKKAKSVEYLAKRLGTSAELLDETAHMRVMTALECITDLQDENENLVKENEELKQIIAVVRLMSCNVSLEANKRLRFYIKNALDQQSEQALKK